MVPVPACREPWRPRRRPARPDFVDPATTPEPLRNRLNRLVGGLRRPAGAVALLLGLAAAGLPPARAAEPAAGVDDWYARIRAAAASQSFVGHYVVTGEGAASSARITHFGQGRDSFERIEPLDGAPRIILRHNETVHTVWPRERLTVVEQRSLLGSFPAPAQATGLRLDDHYRIGPPADGGRVAGRDAQIVTILAKDEWRYSHRLWVDVGTRLLLRTDVLGSQDAVLASAAFTDLTVGVKPQPGLVTAAMKARAENWQVLPSTVQATTLQAEGLRIEPLPPGYRLLSCVRRPLEPAAKGATPAGTAVQAVYTDGLASVSVFVEEAGGSSAPSGMLRTGATTTVMQQRDRYRVTVVGDVPAQTARRFADAVQRKLP